MGAAAAEDTIVRKQTKVSAPIRIIIASFLVWPVFAQDAPWDQHMEAGRAALEQRRVDDAEKNLMAALEEAEGFGSSDSRLITTLRSPAKLDQRQGVRISQVPIRKRFAEICEGQLSYTHPDLVPALLELASPAGADPDRRGSAISRSERPVATVRWHGLLLWMACEVTERGVARMRKLMEWMTKTKTCPLGRSQTPQLRGLRQPATKIPYRGGVPWSDMGCGHGLLAAHF